MPDESVKDESIKTVDLESIACRFEMRATKLRKRACGFLVFIILMLSLGVAVFLTAAHITAKDLGTADDLNQQLKNIDKTIEEREKKIEDINSRIKNIGEKASTDINKLEDEKKPLLDKHASLISELNDEMYKKILSSCKLMDREGVASNTEPDISVKTADPITKHTYYITSSTTRYHFASQELAEDCVRQFDEKISSLFKDTSSVTRQISTYNEKISQLLEPIREYRKEITTLDKETHRIKSIREDIANQIIQNEVTGRKGKTTDENTKSDWPTLIQTNTARFGSLLIILFLVNNLFAQYRYNLRLAVYLEARADALRLRSDQITVQDFERLVTALTPTFDFGKPAATPVEQVIELANALKGK